MKALFITAFLLNVAFSVWSYFILPETVANHFGAGGEPNGWMSKDTNMLISMGMQVPLFFIFLYTADIVFKLPAKLISLPNKKYWLSDQNKEATQQKLSSLMHEFGAMIFAFLLAVNALVIQANMTEPHILNEPLFFTAFIAFMGFTIYWTIKVFLDFRLPKEENMT